MHFSFCSPGKIDEVGLFTKSDMSSFFSIFSYSLQVPFLVRFAGSMAQLSMLLRDSLGLIYVTVLELETFNFTIRRSLVKKIRHFPTRFGLLFAVRIT